MPTISGLTIIRNGITCGYPFVETIECLNSICDEIIVCEGYSTDSTLLILEYLSQKYPKLTVYQDNWNTNNIDGYEFARITNLGLSRCTCDYILYLQADEILHQDNLQSLKAIITESAHNSIALPFQHFRYSMQTTIKEDCAYATAIRVIRNIPTITSHTDAWSFDGNINPSYSISKAPTNWIYHMGYVFPYNIIAKMINHYASYYKTSTNHKVRYKTARSLLDRMLAGAQITSNMLHNKLEPNYPLVKFNHPLPECILPYANAKYYDPHTRHPKLPLIPELILGPTGHPHFLTQTLHQL